MEQNIAIEILKISGACVSVYVAWIFGKKQRIKNESLDPISRGADKIVEVSERLLDKVTELKEKETEHRIDCEEKLKEQDKKIELLKEQIKKINK